MFVEQQVVLVAHSLGCRVALECLAEIRAQGDDWTGAKVVATCLMAAAVPTPLCTAPGAYDTTLSDCCETVLYSTHDRVLTTCFRPGQSLYGEKGQAVGYEGMPSGRWNCLLHKGKNTAVGHGDYWTNGVVAHYLGGVLGGVYTVPLDELPLNEWQLPATPDS